MVAEITAAGGTAVADYSDVATAGEQAVEACVAAFGGIDVLISNAGQLEDRSLKNMTVEEFTSVVTTHAIGGFRAMKGAWPHMNEQKKGRIVFIGSIAAWYGGFGQGNCASNNDRALALSPHADLRSLLPTDAAAKGALAGLSQVCAVEGLKNNVLSNLICTEGITRMNEDLIPQENHEALKPEYAANGVLVLAHDSCPTTGQMYQIEGGTLRKIRVQVSKGLKYDPTTEGLDHVSENWEDSYDFTDATAPAEAKHPLIDRATGSPKL